jgi:16S rRNA (cytidine1402-2'-O)-methyltransferase
VAAPANPGTLYLIPAPLGTGNSGSRYLASLPQEVRLLRRFVVENAKSARRVLGQLATALPLQTLELQELNEHTPASQLAELLAPLLAGEDVGLLSDAGCPAIADPGALLVRLAHEHEVRVVPLIGPCSIVLALMACGLEGQRFAFGGYLPQKPPQREAAISEAEIRSGKFNETQVFIEAPYRNDALFNALLATCRASTLLSVATDLTLESEAIRTCSVGRWRETSLPAFNGRPSIFLLLAQPG